MKEKLRAILPWLVVPAFYLFCFAIFAVVTFPIEKLRDKVVTQFNAQQKNGSTELQIDELNSNFITGVKAKGVRLLTAPTEPGKGPTELRIDEAKARISVLGLLVGHRDITFSLLLAGGEAYGSYEEHGKDRAFEINLENVDVGQIEPITAQLGVPMEGKMNGQVKLSLPDGKTSKTVGTLNLEVAGVGVGDGKAKLKGLLALPKLDVGNLDITAEAKDGQLKITKLVAGGKDAELSGDGRVTLRENAADALLDVNVKFKINDNYKKKNEQTKAIFGEPGSKVPALFDLDPKVSRAKTPDGFYAFRIRGSLGHPQFDPGSSIGGSVGGSGANGGLHKEQGAGFRMKSPSSDRGSDQPSGEGP